MLAMMLRFPAECGEAARQAIRLWGLDIVPSLFPYMVLCRMLSSRLYTCGIPVSVSAAVLGLLGGSPSGSAVLAGYGCPNSRRKTYALCVLTGTISPMFLLGTVSTWIADSGISGTMLLASHVAGAFLSAAVVFFCIREKNIPLSCAGIGQRIQTEDPIRQSIEAVFSVGGYIVFYSIIASLIGRIRGLNQAAASIIHALLEISGGMRAISLLNVQPEAKAVMLAAASGFSGLSILSQNWVFLKALGIQMRELIGLAILRSLFAACVMLLLMI